MPQFSILSPLDQPLGSRRLLEDLKRFLSDPELNEFGFAVAFAKVGPLYRLQELLEAWIAQGKTATGIFGIDHKGTSLQALTFAVENLSDSYFTQQIGNSFHPKIYWFKGATKAVAYIGSNNLTVGGTEINFEAGVELSFELPAEEDDFSVIMKTFDGLLPDQCPVTHLLTTETLAALISGGLLLDESVVNRTGAGGRLPGYRAKTGVRLPVLPASSLPKGVFGKRSTKQALASKAVIIQTQAEKVDVTKPLTPVTGLAIQINPHDNGEIFLSSTAAKQNPAFFGMPFTGITTPKQGSKNGGYPQRFPDPVCNIRVIGDKDQLLLELPGYELNTVFYTKKSEIRVTASPLVPVVPAYSVMIMYFSGVAGIDYEMDIHTPESPEYERWVEICNQKMPGGGKKEPRWFGWF